jgi:ribosome modulation factor
LAEILTTAFDVEDTAEGLKMLEHRAAKVGDPAVDEVRSFEEAEAAFTRAEADRTRVGQALCNGYNAGVIGDARQNFHFTHPSHEGFAWFNGWALGDWDRRWKARLVKGTYEQHRAMLKAAKQPVVST